MYRYYRDPPRPSPGIPTPPAPPSGSRFTDRQAKAGGRPSVGGSGTGGGGRRVTVVTGSDKAARGSARLGWQPREG